MKKLGFLLIAFLVTWGLKAQPAPQPGINGKATRYAPGFSYQTPRGEKATLLRWVNAGRGPYRWEVLLEMGGKTYKAWTDDQWIDVATGKAFLSEQTNQVMYYDSLLIK